MDNYKTIFSAVLVGAGLFLTWAWTLPSYQAASAFKNIIIEKQADFDKKKEIIEKIKVWKSEYDQRADEITRFASIVPKKKGTEELIIALEQVAANNGLNLSAINIAEITNRIGSYDAIELTLSLSGPYLSVPFFLGQVEKSLRLMDINGMELNLLQDQGSGSLSIKMKVKAYVLKEKPIIEQGSGRGGTED